MKNNFDSCLALVLKEEGGYQDDPNDRGNRLSDGRKGSTNMGVTQAAWEEYVNQKVTQDDIKALTINDIIPFYKIKYWDIIKGDLLPIGLDYAVFDYAVNAGTGRAVKVLQQVLNVPSDGLIGPMTFAEIEQVNPRSLITEYCDARLAFYQRLPDFGRYGKTWSQRVADVEKAAFDMAA